ncbi:MAG: low molecular weight phosphotyrosine protein phosphatase [Ignavibacteriales bacterium]|nr:MAG: low molecular weight phosphotyrosine protein phosphatase [Ignavibacteriales bacterium]
MNKLKVLFVCMGNICRSPSAEIVFQNIVDKNGLTGKFEIDSAGTIGYHEGEKADARMRMHASTRGYNITHLARKFNAKIDFEKFDYILVMDDDNFRDITNQDKQNKYIGKIKKITDYSTDKMVTEVPDPYYGGPSGFEKVLDILEDSCENFFSSIKNEI